MKKFTYLDAVALVVWLVPAVYVFIIYGSMPQTVPVHYGLNGNIDRYGSKSEFLTTEWVLLGISALVYLLLKYLPNIDPKKQVKYGEATFQKLGLGIIIFFAGLNISFTFATVHRGFQIDKLILPLVGLMFVFIGNIMNSIKPNYFAGFRTPWALENEDNWRATHRLVSKIWFAGGILVTVAALLLPPAPATTVMLCMVAVMTIVPFAYSYMYFKKHRLNQNS
ncbi:MAG TPA: SdpI family protein [Mucilaginibacter sp.]|jgi:uncharacterized membrane protein|nr:SdpI family protein [Mucilaginibacter sp.]